MWPLFIIDTLQSYNNGTRSSLLVVQNIQVSYFCFSLRIILQLLCQLVANSIWPYKGVAILMEVQLYVLYKEI